MGVEEVADVVKEREEAAGCIETWRGVGVTGGRWRGVGGGEGGGDGGGRWRGAGGGGGWGLISTDFRR